MGAEDTSAISSPHAAVKLAFVSGPIAVGIASGVIILALVAVASRAGGGFELGTADWAAIRFTVHQACWSALISVLVAIPLARALARRDFPGRAILVLLLGAPFILPVITAVMGLLIVFGRSGWLNALFGQLGLPEISIYGFTGVVLAHVFFNIPLATRFILSGWQSIPAERFRLSAQLGLTPSTVFRILEVPVLRQTVPGAFALIFVLCLTSFAVALTLGGGPRATTVELAIYQAFRFDFDLGKAAILSLVQLLMAGSAAAAALWFIPKQSLTGGLDRPTLRWDGRSPTLVVQDAIIIGLGAAFLIVPLAAVVVRGIPGLWDLPPSILTAAGNSIWVAAVSTILMLLFCLPIAAWIAARRFGGVEALGVLALAASPLMIGTGWFLIVHPFANPASLAFFVTALVNALVALPFALRILVPPMRETMAVYGRLAASLSVQSWAFWRIVLMPRIRPQLGFAAGLTAALSVGDLGVVTLFADPDRATLPLVMYRLTAAYRTDAASGAALLLLLLALAAFWVCDWWGRRHA